MSGLWRDVRLGLRALRRAPGVTLAILASLGLGIGAVATAFAWYEGWVLRPIAHATEQDRLVWLNTQAPGGGRCPTRSVTTGASSCGWWSR